MEFGAAKVDAGLPIFNYAVGYDVNNREPLMYEKYSGSINDVSQLQFMVDKIKGYGYKNIGLFWTGDILAKIILTTWTAVDFPLSLW